MECKTATSSWSRDHIFTDFLKASSITWSAALPSEDVTQRCTLEGQAERGRVGYPAGMRLFASGRTLTGQKPLLLGRANTNDKGGRRTANRGGPFDFVQTHVGACWRRNDNSFSFSRAMLAYLLSSSILISEKLIGNCYRYQLLWYCIQNIGNFFRWRRGRRLVPEIGASQQNIYPAFFRMCTACE